MEILEWLMNWYKENCDGDWEHTYGLKIVTLDNPGWMIDINLEYTLLEGKEFTDINIDNGDNDWINCRIKDNVFQGYGDPDKLIKILEIFKDWVENNS